ncbi:Oidioi.mRNA.OKI2018_I69.XSR.g16592.t2.cds [Oikopleura dioica]|uniref:Oidioi.mRNA.OKI2018_I69.XSR.g16592.t2.cds n=1 Tax=Oikopleura dioica TaxID=34765 RepID=A0ABN7SGL2_OIKDI|nr:Oidioi.mRNA.OKI2018_I69.XSR.g16592.t2.cds [Oikopleura dioica]
MKKMRSLILVAQIAESCRRSGFSRKRRQSGTPVELVENAIIPFAYCLQKDPVVLEEVILAGPNSDPSNTDPYCYDECGPDGLGEYDVDECVACYKDEDRIEDITEKYIARGGFSRMTPSIQQVQDCIDFYLPTILTSEEPELFIENTNNRQLAGRIEVPDIIKYEYDCDTSDPSSCDAGSNFWEGIIRVPEDSSENSRKRRDGESCFFEEFSFENAAVLGQADDNEFIFKQRVPAAVLPRFYSVDRLTSKNYEIEFGWDSIGYLYAYGDLENVSVPQTILATPQAFNLTGTTFISYKNDILVDKQSPSSYAISFSPNGRSYDPGVEVATLNMETLAADPISPFQFQLKSVLTPGFREVESASTEAPTNNYVPCIPNLVDPPKCKTITNMPVNVTLSENRSNSMTITKMILNQANKLIKQENKNQLVCEDYSVCQIKIKYLDFPEGRACDEGLCHDALISTGCVGWKEGNACQAYIDNSSDAIFYSNKKGEFFYHWESSENQLYGTASKNKKPLKLDGKKDIVSMLQGLLLVEHDYVNEVEKWIVGKLEGFLWSPCVLSPFRKLSPELALMLFRFKTAEEDEELWNVHRKEYGLDFPPRILRIIWRCPDLRYFMAYRIQDWAISFRDSSNLHCELVKLVKAWTEYDKEDKMLNAFAKRFGKHYVLDAVVPVIRCLFSPLPTIPTNMPGSAHRKEVKEMMKSKDFPPLRKSAKNRRRTLSL